MLTFFTTAKPFRGHSGIIQRNAIRSWQRVHPDVEIILLGDDPGAEEVCQERGIRHIKEVRKNRYGTKYLASIYDQAQEIARHDLLCHVNCDIVLMGDFRLAVESVSRRREQFLMAGRRWDVDLREALDFDRPGWEEELRQFARKTNRQRQAQWIDYFVFNKALFYQKIPEFVIGRPGWDNWLLWFSIFSNVPVIDASEAVCAVHQNHDYSYHPEGEQGVWQGEEAQDNYRLLENHRKFRTLESATYLLRSNGLKMNHKRWFVKPKHELRRLSHLLWFSVLDLSRPLRRRIGLRQRTRI